MNSTVLRLTAALAILLAGSVPPANAQTAEPINVVTTAVPFLRISPDARSGGMGDLSLATRPDAAAAYFNLAKVPFNESKAGMNVTYTPWLKRLVNDVYLASVAGYYKFNEDQAFSGSLRYFSLGDIQFTDAFGNPLQSFRPREFGIEFGYSRRLSERTGVGVGLKYIHSNLAGGSVGGNTYKPGNAVAGDLTMYHQRQNELGEGWAFGLALTNLGSKISYTDQVDQKDFIPANLGIGTTYTKVFDESNRISFGIDLNKLLVPTPPMNTGDYPRDSAALVKYRGQGVMGSWFGSFGDAPGGFSEELREFQASLGAEYWYNDQFSVRAGYFYEDKTKGNRRYFTTGVGIKYNIFGLNFSYLIPSGIGSNQNPLSNTLRFSLVFDFADAAGE
jgi:hypothetical protein